jgi:Flp pilus assembly CpaE family ATPase
MMSSRNAGVPLLQHAPRSKIQQSIASLADTLCGKGVAEDDKKKRSGFFSFRS